LHANDFAGSTDRQMKNLKDNLKQSA